MRGAGLRLHNDVRRLWRCPVCGLERRAGAEVTSVACECPGSPDMRLIESRRLERGLKEPVSPYLEFVFEPGELNPPRPPVEEPPLTETRTDEEPSAAISDPENRADDPSSRPPRQDSRSSRRSERRDGHRQSGKQPGRPPRDGRPEAPNRSDPSPSKGPANDSNDSATPPADLSSPSNPEVPDDFGAGL